nr:MAG TPA: hypothetical protein [Caudoviricetes sp.]
MVEHLAKNFSPAFLFHRFAGLFVVAHVVHLLVRTSLLR